MNNPTSQNGKTQKPRVCRKITSLLFICDDHMILLHLFKGKPQDLKSNSTKGLHNAKNNFMVPLDKTLSYQSRYEQC